ncbi:MAG: radical SAM family heme chaperone HemW [Desulfarculaceae bacterium]|nr:radical SAM family heme chaperone HemW [Desulfarculaceae bacterium]
MSDPLAIYIHVPFCRAKCRYCDFFSITDLSMIEPFVNAVTREIEQKRETDRRVHTVYVGGGTPSLLEVRRIEKLLGAVRQCFDVADDAEVTVEVNPGTVDKSWFSDLAATGVNRVNIGVQSFDDQKLEFLGRVHSAGTARKSVEAAFDAGIGNIGMDLIYCVPNEDVQAWFTDLETACGFGPSHLSCYTLTFEKGTPLFRMMEAGRADPMDKESVAGRFKATSRFLTENGWFHYEISNFAKGEENRSRHNTTYWRNLPYTGFGPGAHSYDGIGRSWNRNDVSRYIRDLGAGKKPDGGSETLSNRQQLLETAMLGLRTREGMDIKEAESLVGTDFYTFFNPFAETLENRGMAVSGEGRFFLTLEGMCRLDDIVSSFADRILSATFSS